MADKFEELCKKTLDNMKEDQYFMGPGRRNDDTVNLLIVCTALGYVDPDDFVFDHPNTSDADYDCYKEHADRIGGYLSSWFSYASPEPFMYMIPDDNCAELRSEAFKALVAEANG